MKSSQLNSCRLGVFGAFVSLVTMVGITTATAAPASAAAPQHRLTVTDQRQQPQLTTQRTHNELRFRNYYKSPVYVALMYRDYSGGCDDYGGWATKGWWKVDRGETVHVLNTKNRHVYFYAKSAGGQAVWSGNSSYMYVNDSSAFNSCKDIGSTAWRRVGLRHVNMGESFTVHTVNLRK
ncbi:DUF1036 domain-containing protein [Carbonactinospora thermoautotrophica]|uniref:DUF1036 domain-containing protein n=1 Tax=Carbonactinospora thermoautotrophica TaxID=1469144 RepID=UPI00226DD4C4|nr:DUF1036 domain-containing protein [Carbonactinospora thermoautotrophica]